MKPEATLTLVTQPAESLQNAFWYGGSLMKLLVSGEQTDGRYSQVEMTVQPGAEPPLHTHTREEETFYLLEGSIEFTVGRHLVTANAGDYVRLPKGIRHGFKVLTPSAKAVLTIAPAGFERYFCDPRLSQPAPQATLPPLPPGPPPAEAIEMMVKMLDQEYAVYF